MTTTTEATMTTNQPRPNGPDPTPEPLGPGWLTVTVVIGIMAALIGLDGMVLSFRAVSAEMIPAFGQWAPGVPLGVDLAVFVFSGVDLLLARLDMRHPLPRGIVYAATAATIALNAAAGGDLPGRLAHVAMPLLWVGFVEVVRHVVRTRVGLATGTLRQPIPAARWLLAPWPTLKLWRRMILWQTNSYTRALGHERERLRKAAALRQEHGRLWRLRVTPLVRLELNLGPAEPETNGSAAPAPTPATEPANPPANHAGEPQPNREPAAANPVRRTAPTGRPRPNPAQQGDQLRAKRLQIIREMAAVTHDGKVPLTAIQARFNCAKSTASEMRKEAMTPPDAVPDPSAGEEPEPDRQDGAA